MLAKNPITENFGVNVFDDQSMREKLPRDIYRKLKETIDTGARLDPSIASVVGNAMKDWAIEKGATHFTHIFQPLNDKTAEKHDSFLTPTKDGIVLELSGSQLVMGEPDASSFPNGGLRATFEARGYTAWDCTSPAFIKEDNAGNLTLCIPTAFCSYKGEALDKKTPLLRSMEVLSKHALRIVKIFGDTTAKRVMPTVGSEQEYFLIEKKHFEQRLDLRNCGRTLFGASAPKNQEMGEQYFGSIKDYILAFMADLDRELWKLGIYAKTRHNEVAPNQFEMAPIFTTANIAVDQNQLVMETMSKLAFRHNLVCLLHEKPFQGVNGSGKHNNWSLSTDTGVNLLEPGNTPHENQQFLVILAALIKAVDTHADILRASVSSAGNDHRLSSNEAPPVIISIFMGTELTKILESFASGASIKASSKAFLQLGVDSLPPLPQDNSDRNRTSPFAFTGNKFEFRMMPSSISIAMGNTVLNTIVAEAFDEIATRLENSKDISKEAAAIVKDCMNHHSRIIFNGDGYSASWKEEAQARKLPFLADTVEAVKTYLTPQSIALFEKYHVLSKEETRSRVDVLFTQYNYQINIEALTAIRMIETQYVPAIIKNTKHLADTIVALKAAGAPAKIQENLLKQFNTHLEAIAQNLQILKDAQTQAKAQKDHAISAEIYRDKVLPLLNVLRKDIDAAEGLSDAALWPVPTYMELLFGIH